MKMNCLASATKVPINYGAADAEWPYRSKCASDRVHRARYGLAPRPDVSFEGAPEVGGVLARSRAPSAIRRILFLVDDAGSHQQIDPTLQIGALVVVDIHRPCELDERLIEALFGFLGADLVFDIPKRFVDQSELRREQAKMRIVQITALRGAHQSRQLPSDVVDGFRRLQSFPLDLEDRDPVDEFSPGDGDRRVGGNERVPGSSFSHHLAQISLDLREHRIPFLPLALPDQAP